jgi:hypothetical protein
MTVDTARGTLPQIRLDPVVFLRTASGVAAAVLSQYVGEPRGIPLNLLLFGAALVLLPLDLLPALAIVMVRDPDVVLGPLTLSDAVALTYLARVVVSNRVLRVRITPARIALGLFLLWATFVTVTGVGLLSALGRVAVYAVFGVAISYRPQGKRWLYLGIVGLATLEVVLYLPTFPTRFYGAFVGDPAHMGFLATCALLIVFGSTWPSWVKLSCGGLLAFGVVATVTRSVWFAVGCVAVAAVLPRRWYLPLLLPPLLGAALLPLTGPVTEALGLNTHSGALRLYSMEAGMREFWLHPLVGEGWASASAAHERGLPGISQVPVYNVWIYIGVSTGIVGALLFLVFVALLGREAVDDSTAYLCLVGMLAMSLTEMPFYGVSLIAVLFFALTTASRAGRMEPDTPSVLSELSPLSR